MRLVSGTKVYFRFFGAKMGFGVQISGFYSNCLKPVMDFGF